MAGRDIPRSPLGHALLSTGHPGRMQGKRLFDASKLRQPCSTPSQDDRLLRMHMKPQDQSQTMNENHTPNCEHDFALVISGVHDLTDDVADALFEAGCDDGTVSMQQGRLYVDFSRSAICLQDAIISAISDVIRADIGAEMIRVDDCDLLPAAEIARRSDRTPQCISQYISGVRGPGNFPPPSCYLVNHKPLWSWCEVSYWLSQGGFVKPQISADAEVIAAINNEIDSYHQRQRNPELRANVTECLQACG